MRLNFSRHRVERENKRCINNTTHALVFVRFTFVRVSFPDASNRNSSRANNEPSVSRLIEIEDCPCDCRAVNLRRVTGRRGVMRNAIRGSYTTVTRRATVRRLIT